MHTHFENQQTEPKNGGISKMILLFPRQLDKWSAFIYLFFKWVIRTYCCWRMIFLIANYLHPLWQVAILVPRNMSRPAWQPWQRCYVLLRCLGFHQPTPPLNRFFCGHGPRHVSTDKNLQKVSLQFGSYILDMAPSCPLPVTVESEG